MPLTLSRSAKRSHGGSQKGSSDDSAIGAVAGWSTPEVLMT